MSTVNNRQQQKKMSKNLFTGLIIELPSCTDRADVYDLELPQPFRTLGMYQQLSGHRRLCLRKCFPCFPASITQSIFLTRLQGSFIDDTLIGHCAVSSKRSFTYVRAAAAEYGSEVTNFVSVVRLFLYTSENTRRVNCIVLIPGLFNDNNCEEILTCEMFSLHEHNRTQAFL